MVPSADTCLVITDWGAVRLKYNGTSNAGIPITKADRYESKSTANNKLSANNALKI